MQHRLRFLLPLLVLAACSEEPPTGPTSGEMAESHSPGHKVVNSLADPGNGVCNAAQCTLREAINHPQSTEISFAPGLTGTITLARPAAGGNTLVIEKNLSITGPSRGIIIRRRTTDPDFRIFRIGPAVTVKLTNLTISNGKTGQRTGGGGIVNFGTLELNNCTVAGNSATQGGGISNQGGTLRLTRSTVADNSGGGITSSNGTLTLTNSVVADNAGSRGGGGIFNVGGPATITNTRIVGNSTTGFGGGIENSNGRFTLTNSTVARNSAAANGGGISNTTATFTITNSTIAGNSASAGSGGGIENFAGPRLDATTTLTNSTISGNSAAAGGGIVNGGGFSGGSASVGLTNSTVTRNSAAGAAGGIRGGDNEDNSVRLTNSLVAQNRAPRAPDVEGTAGLVQIVVAHFSLIGDGTGSGFSDGVNGNQVGTASAPIDPRLGPLANNGGSTRTHALLVGSPAIDAASTPDCPTTDQRGVLRPQGAACDIGSYERKVP